jgi:hypothetical protein
VVVGETWSLEVVGGGRVVVVAWCGFVVEVTCGLVVGVTCGLVVGVGFTVVDVVAWGWG